METPTPKTSPAAPEAREAEFDRFAAGYDGSMDAPLKGLLGGNQDAYLDVKARWLLRDLVRRPLPCGAAPKLLDYGCGAGHLLRALRRLGFEGDLAGCDPSRGMLDEARRAWTGPDAPLLEWMPKDELPFEDARFDLVVASAVFHHIPPAARVHAARESVRVLRPGGRFVIVEHNTKNPVTRFVVKRAKVDENAILLPSGETQALLAAAGLERPHLEYVMFFPPRFAWASGLEARISWLPLGGQYVATGDRTRA
jgi:SAM-dependent methyltransferase